LAEFEPAFTIQWPFCPAAQARWST
jgi:hypothetical protein